MTTTAKEDIKFVKNLAKEAEGLTETEISNLETVSEEDMAKFPEGEIIQPIVPETIPTVEEIEKMEKVEVLPEEDKADADFPSNEGAVESGRESDTTTVESTGGTTSSDGDSEDVESSIDSEELEKILKEFDNINITVEDVKHQKDESEDFKDIELSDEVYQDIIHTYASLQNDPQSDVLMILGPHAKQELLVQANKLGINTNDMTIYKFFIEGFIREICGNAFMDKGRDLVDTAVKKVNSLEETKEISKLLEDYIEETYENRITEMNRIMDSTDNPEVHEHCINVLNANNDAKEYGFLYKALNDKPSYLNVGKAFKHQQRNVEAIHDALARLNIKNINVGVFMDSISEFTSFELESVNIFSILMELLVVTTNFSDKVQMMRLYTMMLLLSGALHSMKTKQEVSGIFQEVAFNYQRLCSTISTGFKAYENGLKAKAAEPKAPKTKKRRK
jgi:hypothetical protein|nr:MAG TPA: hypothetical protein [Caudoviricetes sp.]